MSALEHHKAHPVMESCVAANRRITELEAELADCAKTCGGLEFHRDALLEELDDLKAELAKRRTESTNDEVLVEEYRAELAARKARRCETCDHGEPVSGTDDEPRVYCGKHSTWWNSDAHCSEWTPREDR